MLVVTVLEDGCDQEPLNVGCPPCLRVAVDQGTTKCWLSPCLRVAVTRDH